MTPSHRGAADRLGPGPPRPVSGSEFALVVTAAIWGLAFAAQRSGMAYLGPFTFNALRFGLGSAALVPLAVLRGRNADSRLGVAGHRPVLLAGAILFAGASLQQLGIVHTTAGKAGFITGLYVVFVPILGLAIGRAAVGEATWVGAAMAVAGLWLLSGPISLAGAASGDGLVLAGAIAWAAHVHVVDRFGRRYEPIGFAVGQFAICALLSALVAAVLESRRSADLAGAAVPLVYAGLVSVAVGYTLQVVGQRGTPPSRAALLMSLEAVFAAVGGWVVLGETMNARETLGAALMLAAMLVSRSERSEGPVRN